MRIHRYSRLLKKEKDIYFFFIETKLSSTTTISQQVGVLHSLSIYCPLYCHVHYLRALPDSTCSCTIYAVFSIFTSHFIVIISYVYE